MKNKLRNYKNEVWLSFEQKGNDFTLKVPHYRKWLDIISFLQSRGFTITENTGYKEHYPALSKYHKIGFKKDVACLMEIGNASITINFGHIKNLWKGDMQAFWDNPRDDRYTKLSYLENISVKLEIKRLLDYCAKFKLPFVQEDYNLRPEEYIINSLQNNTHIHGVVTCLNDIKLHITEDSYNYKFNSDDKNKKKIICGETKYFYDSYTNRLSYGIVWHHINNMWWVISGGKLYNIVCWDYFDYEVGMPRRKPATQDFINILLKKYVKKTDYERCAKIQKYHKVPVLQAA